MKLKISKISKKFGSVKANSDINLEIESNKIHALLGENGAGKSTLVKIISGHYKPDSGEIYVNKKLLQIEQRSLWNDRRDIITKTKLYNRDIKKFKRYH